MPPGPPQQTGLLPQADGRNGVFIRDVDAIIYAADLWHAIRWGSSLPPTTIDKLTELAQLLEQVKQW